MRILIASILISFFITRILNDAAYPHIAYTITSYFMRDRIESMSASIQQIRKTSSQTVALWGTSEIEGFVNPQAVSKIINPNNQDLNIYNFGVRALHPEQFLRLAKIWTDEFTPTNSKFKLSIVKIPISRLTKRFEIYHANLDKKPLDSFFLKSDEFLPLFVTTPHLSVDLFVEKYCFSKSGSNASSYLVDSALKNAFEPISDKAEDAQNKFFMSLWRWPEFQEKPQWDIKKNGFYNWNRPDSDTLYQSVLETKRRKNTAAWGVRHFNQTSGILSLDWSETLVKQMILTIQEIQKMSDDVVVLILPDGEDLRAYQNPNTERKINELYSIFFKQGFKIFNFNKNELNLSPENYVDFFHLDEDGWDKVFQHLVAKNIIQIK